MKDTALAVIGEVQTLNLFAEDVKLNHEPNIDRLLDNSKVSDHYAIIPTSKIATAELYALPQEQQQVLALIAGKLLCAVSAPYAYHLSGNKELADDIVQTAFLQIISHVSTVRRIKDRGRVKAYLNTTVRNIYYNHQKSESRKPQLTAFEQIAEMQDETSLEETVINKILTDTIIESLTEQERDILTLYYFVGLSTREIGETVHLTAGNVKVILHRIRKKSKQDFGGNGYEK